MGMSMLSAEHRVCVAVLLMLAFLFGNASLAFAQNVDILRLKDVKVGMKGFGKTVVLGRKIETFDVEVLGILANNKVNENVLINGKSILVKVSGEVIKRAGGIAAGMSGSPVYIDGKLMGGISSGWIMTDHTVGLVTPIEEMLEIWSYPDMACSDTGVDNLIRRWIPEAPLQLGGNPVSAILEAPFDIAHAIRPAAGEAVFQQASVDVYIEGLYGRAADVLKSKLQKKNVIIARKGALPGKEDLDGIERQDATAETFEPGSALGIQLARGDINMTTLGTVTHRSGPRILALAHPFLKKGAVSFLLTGAYIHHSFSSVQMPFKIGAPTEMLGVITQDREKGLSGEIGRLPEMVPVQIDVFDKNLQINRSINYQIVRDPSVFVMVLESTLIQALEGVIDRAGPGTALMGVSLDCSNRKGEKYNFRRENMFYSRTDIVQALINEVTSLIDMVTSLISA